MIVTVTPNPCVDKTVFVDALEVGAFIRSDKCTCIPGGKGTNVSRAVKALGRATRALVVVGGHTGSHVVDMIEKQDGVACVPAWVASPTRTITTVLEEPIHRQTAFFEPGSRVTEAEKGRIVETFVEAVKGAAIVTFCGTVSDPAIKTLYRDLIPLAHKAGALAILDSHGPEFALGLEAVPYMVKPNVVETEEWLGRKLDSEQARSEAVARFHEAGVTLVALSLGRNGALISRGDLRFQVVPPPIREVNPVGSGDAFLAGFAIGLMERMPLEEMAVLACAAGTANAMSWNIGHFDATDVADLAKEIRIRHC